MREAQGRSLIRSWAATIFLLAGAPAGAADMEGVWQADVPAGTGFYQGGWAVARFDKDGSFSMAIVHQRDRDHVERLHFYTGRWTPSNSTIVADSLSFIVGRDPFESEPWTFTRAGDTLTDDVGGFTWRRRVGTHSVVLEENADLPARWIGADSASERFSLALESTGEAQLRGDRVSLGFEPGGTPVFNKVDRNDAFFQISGRWSTFADLLVLHSTAYSASDVGHGQYGAALAFRAVQGGDLQLRSAINPPLVFTGDKRVPQVPAGAPLAPAKRPAHLHLAQSAAAAPLSMLYEGDTEQACRNWQQQFRSKLLELMGDSTPPERWQVEELSRRKYDDHTRLELLLHANDAAALPVYLLIPTGVTAEQPAPGVLCIHGHGPFGNDAVVGRRELEGAEENIARHNYDYGLQFVRRGYVVAAPCMTPFGRRVDTELHRRWDPCAAIFVRMQALGKLLITENVRDLRWSLSLLQRRPEVLADRLGSAGLSYGGRMCMMVSAIDSRIQVASISGAWHLLQERVMQRAYTCGGQIIPGILQYGDYPEIGSLIGPRPCVWEVGSHDRGVNREAGEQVTARLKRAYQSLGAADQLRFDHFEGGHEWSGRVAFSVFDRVLKP